MAKYRSIHEKIWKDPDFQLYSSESKLVFIYLCTNSSTSESGIYAITPKTIGDETSLKIDSVTKILKALKNIMWDEKHNYVYVRRFRVYNGGGAPDNIKKAIVTEFLQSSILPFWNNFVEDYPDYKDAILATGKPLTPTLFPPNPPPNSNSNSNSISIDRLGNLSPTVVQPLVTETKLPEYIKKELWDDFLAMRKKIKQVPTEKAKQLLLEKLEQLRMSGNDPNKVIEQSIMNNWKGLFPLNEQAGGAYHGTSPGFIPQPKGSAKPVKYIEGDEEESDQDNS